MVPLDSYESENGDWSKTQGNGKIQEDEGVSCRHKGIHGMGRRGKDDQHQGTEEHPIAKARLVTRGFNTGDKRGELFAGTPGLMAMRTVIFRAMTKCENGAKRSIMLADVKTALLYGDARRSLYFELPLEYPLSADTCENLNVPCMELATPR